MSQYLKKARDRLARRQSGYDEIGTRQGFVALDAKRTKRMDGKLCYRRPGSMNKNKL